MYNNKRNHGIIRVIKGGNMKKVAVYGAEWCPFCHSVRKWLDQHSIEYTYYDVDEEGREIMEKLVPGNHTIPVVVIDEKAHVNPNFRDLSHELLAD